MADTKLSALTALTGADVDAAVDLLYIDDVSVTTGKKILVSELAIGSQTQTTWTPVLTFATVGDLSVAYSAQVGSYTKIGKLITLTCNIVTTTFTHTTASGALQVTGLPVAAKTLTSYAAEGTLSHAGLTTGSVPVSAEIGSAASLVTFKASSGTPSAISSIAAANTTTGTQVTLNFTIQYESAT